MCDGQSSGFGTRAGDQQYVNGIFSVSTRSGPSVSGIGSRSIDFLHLLMTSPRLCRY